MKHFLTETYTRYLSINPPPSRCLIYILYVPVAVGCQILVSLANGFMAISSVRFIHDNVSLKTARFHSYGKDMNWVYLIANLCHLLI